MLLLRKQATTLSVFLLFATQAFGAPFGCPVWEHDYQSPESIVDAVPLAHYKFLEENGATTFEDSSSNNNDATCATCPDIVGGGLDRAAYFDGTNDRVDTPSGLVNPDTSDLTIALWVHPQNIDGSQRVFVQQADLGGSGRTQLYANAGTNALATFLGGAATTGSVLSNNRWYHVALTSDQTNVTLYLDGVQDATRVDPAETTTGAYYFGEHKNGNGDLNGFEREIIIWSAELDSIQMNDLFTVQAQQLANRYRFPTLECLFN